ncbi:transglutaminaseTgpA domain-containing protein [Arthrobacter sulfonylureivorans]|uniref:transglutaminase family protein n=1 Tax=Arthrobacter sulfonylureivorans TaxID=2486855 RepID=UPI0039E5E3BA
MTVTLDKPADRLAPGTSRRAGSPPPSPGFAPWLMSAAVAVAVLLTAANLHGVLEGWSWLFQVAVTVGAIEAATGLARRLEWPPLTGALLGLAALVMSVNAMFLAPTSFLGVIPGPDTFAALDPLLEEARDTVVSQVAPVLVNPGVALAACVGVGLIALLVDTLAVPLQMPAISGLGLLGLVSVPAMIKPNSIGAAGFLAAAAGYLLLLGCAHWLAADGSGRGRLASAEHLRRASGIAAAGLAAAMVLPLAIPGFSSGLFPEGSRLNWGAPTGLNPVVSLGDNLRRPGAFGRMTYATDAQEPLYLRSVTLENLTGARWSPSPFGGNKRIGIDELDVPGVQNLLASGEVTTTLISTASFTSPWLLVPYAPAQVSGARGQWSWDPSTLNIRGESGTTTANQDYEVRSVKPRLTRDMLRAAEPANNAVVDPVFSELPRSMPDIITDTAATVLDGLDSPFEQAMAIQTYLRTSGFVYSEQAPVDGGYDQSGFDVVAAFLEEKSGYCIHYAATMAIMARIAGIPSRMAVGYAPGRPTGTVLTDGPGADLKEYEIDSRDAHAWPELFFSGVGWVSFEPTPSRGVLPAYAQTETTPGSPTQPEDVLRPTDQPRPGAGAAGEQTEPNSPVPAEDDVLSRQLWSAAAAAVVLGLMLTPLLLRRRRTSRRRAALAAGGTGRRAAVAAWVEAVDAAEDLGWAAAATETPRAFQQRLDDAGVVAGESAAALSRLRAGYERAAYAAPETPAPDGHNAARWADVEAVKGRLQERAGWKRRLAGLFWPASLFSRRPSGADGRRLDQNYLA